MAKIKNFTGLRNVGLPEKAPDGDLQEATNVVFNDDGTLESRFGWELVLATTEAGSLFSCPEGLLFRQNRTLALLDREGIITEVGDLGAVDDVSYVTVAGKTYASNGERSFVYRAGTIGEWGVAPPLQPGVDASSGDLVPGRFAVCLTYQMNDGSESGASHVAGCDSNGGLRISDIVPSTDPRVEGICVYITRSGGEVQEGNGMYRQACLPNMFFEEYFVRAGNYDGATLATFNMVPPPPGSHLCFYKGRIYIASGNVIWHTEPWAYDLVSLDQGHMSVNGRITMLQSTQEGIWVGTEKEFMFLAGNDPLADGGLKVRSRVKTPCLGGAASSNSTDVAVRGLSPGTVVLWLSPDGIYAGDGNGIYTNLTGGKWEPEGASSVCGFMDGTQGVLQYVFGTTG